MVKAKSALGHQEEAGVLPGPRAAVLDDPHAFGARAQPQGHPQPSVSTNMVPPGPGRVRIAASRPPAQQPGAVRRPAVAEVEARVRELVAGAGDQAAGGVQTARHGVEGGLHHGSPVDDVVRDGDVGAGVLVDEEGAAGEPEGIEHQVADRLLVRSPGDHLDHPAGQRDGGVVVREHGSRRGQLRQAVQSRPRTGRARPRPDPYRARGRPTTRRCGRAAAARSPGAPPTDPRCEGRAGRRARAGRGRRRPARPAASSRCR